MTDKNISIDIIKEISTQLQALYGHASAEILPIVLHAISMKSIFDAIANIVAVLIVLILVKFMWVPGIKKSRQEFEEHEEFVPIFRYFGMALATISAPLFIGCAIKNMVYIFAPQAKIIFAIMDGLK